MKIKDLFNLHQGNGFELINMEVSTNSNINFVSRTAENNGVVAKIDEMYKKPFGSGLITVALGGSVLSSFVQTKPFYTGFHIMVLEPKIKMNIEQKLFYCMIISKNKYRYNYGRQANRTLSDIEIPDLNVCNTIINSISINKITTKNETVLHHINCSEWKEFRLLKYFNMEAGQYYQADSFDHGNIPLISASDMNNGVMKNTNLKYEFLENALTIGKVGVTVFYQNNKFVASPDVTVLIPKFRFNKYIGLFLKTIIEKEKNKWCYGRQIRLGDCKSLIIKLPCKNNEPDWVLWKII